MKIVLASSNKGKIKEIQNLLPQYEVVPYSDILGSFEIVEDGKSFQENAIIKAKAVMDKLDDENFKHSVIIADDSGISVPALNFEPNIYSARYAKEGATDQENIEKLISKLKMQNIAKTEAFYTACIAIGYQGKIYTTHGWMYGSVIDTPRGEKGFGYDPVFIPEGESQTLGELDETIKKQKGHRAKALELSMKVLKTILR